MTTLYPHGTIARSTYFGSAERDTGYAIAVAQDGDVYVAGLTGSDGLATTQAFMTAQAGGFDGFVLRLSGSTVVWSSYLGGSGSDHPTDLAIDDDANIYVIGYTSSADFNVEGGFDATMDGGNDGVVTKIAQSDESPVTPG